MELHNRLSQLLAITSVAALVRGPGFT